jgi:uncharacterized protein YcnI
MRTSRPLGRLATVTAVTAASLALAGPAFAHVQVKSDAARALAANATLTFTAEAESKTAGLAKFLVVLPDGIAPGDVTLAQAPQGWTFAATTEGFTVGGPALAPGTDAVYSITVRQLPDAPELVFKTVETYGDGQVDRWIELTKDGVEPDHPAPVLKLAGAAQGSPAAGASGTPAASAPATFGASTVNGGASPTAPTAGGSASGSASASATAPGSPAAAPAVTASAAPVAAAKGGGSASTAPIVLGVVAAVAAAAGGAWWWRRRTSRPAGN